MRELVVQVLGLIIIMSRVDAATTVRGSQPHGTLQYSGDLVREFDIATRQIFLTIGRTRFCL
jgi:hypothetical protein